ncbi:uncharacterized protein IUM83_11907 [Phytophthora cinnamomi]|uniref:uncharacterized protein n=1 Tax=Phytophthora cinnamomi TaxID=4785 RepID=UPI00355A33C4|nr:hypothetical protein IUM83_11907 [Phytophthora cinnamomi]
MSDGGQRYVIAALGYVTRYAVAVTVKQHTAKNVAEFLLNHVVFKFGPFASCWQMELLNCNRRYGNWKLVLLHFGDAEASESLGDLLNVFKAPDEVNREDSNAFLLTATIWNVESDSDLLPPRPAPGTVVDINEYSNLQLYRDTQCQLTARLTQMVWPNEH